MHPIEGTAWRLVRGVDIPPGVEITARFAGGTVSGRAGVNRYRADYRLQGGVLELGPAATTLMAGDPAAMRTEHDFLQLLGTVDEHKVEGDTLVLMDRGHQPILWFEAGPPVGDALSGRWDVVFVRRGEAMVSPTAATAPYLEFDAEGQISGSGGVNRISGPVRADGDRVHLGPLTSTRMAGPADAMDDEAALIDALESVASFRVDDDELVLLDDDGESRVQLVRPTA